MKSIQSDSKAFYWTYLYLVVPIDGMWPLEVVYTWGVEGDFLKKTPKISFLNLLLLFE